MEVYYLSCSLLAGQPRVCPVLDASQPGHALPKLSFNSAPGNPPNPNYYSWYAAVVPALCFKRNILLRSAVRLSGVGIAPANGVAPQLNQVEYAKTLVLGQTANGPARESSSESVRNGREIVMFLLLLIVVLVLLFGGGGGYYGYRRWGTGGGIGIVGLVVILLLFFYLFGGMRM
jgi:hypothetical protein